MASHLSRWYGGDSSKSLSHAFAPAEAAFAEGLNTFKQQLTKDPRKRERVEQLQAASLQDVLDAVVAAKTRYESRRTDNKAKDCLIAFSRRVRYYGEIMDVMVEHHPEYVSLVWGAMKLFFGAFIEHENTASTIVTALCDIADSLPRIELASTLYLTDIMQSTVALLYAHIVHFLIRALQWYEEGKLKRALHSITKPAALRYDDLIKDIQRDARSIASHAVTSSQAEQRDMHVELRELRGRTELAISRSREEQQEVMKRLNTMTTMVVQLRESIALDQSVNASARIEFRNALSEIQLAQALDIISSQCQINHKSSFETFMALRNRRRFTRHARVDACWTSPKLKDWSSSPASSTMLIKATFRERLEVRDFCTNVIEQLVTARVATLWILRDRDRQYSLPEVLKSLILQALSLDYLSHSDVVFSFQLRRFLDSHIDEDYLNLLGDNLQHFQKVYIVADAGAMSSEVSDECRAQLCRLSRRLFDRNASTVVKVIVSSCGPERRQLTQQPLEDVVLRVGQKAPQKRHRVLNERNRRGKGYLPAVVPHAAQAGRQRRGGPSAIKYR